MTKKEPLEIFLDELKANNVKEVQTEAARLQLIASIEKVMAQYSSEISNKRREMH